MTTEIAISGAAGQQKLRAVCRGLCATGGDAAEGVAPFGPRRSSCRARGECHAFLPRDQHVLRGAKPEDILGR